MKIMIIKEIEVDVRTLKVAADVRYYEDATVNGVADVDGLLIPCKSGKTWMPEIDIASGMIKNWEQGKTADIHYKVCDAGSYYLLDEQGKEVLSIENDYVPDCMCPEERGYGDYIIMTVDESGFIKGWQPIFKDFPNQS
jgi:hypothetical protein